MLRLLCIANPARYASSVTDVPLSYARLAAHPDVELYHAETAAVLAATDRIEATQVPLGFLPDEFRTLPSRPTMALPPEHFDIAFDRTLKPFPEGLYDRLGALSARLRFVNDPAGIQRHLDPAFLLRAAADHLPPMLLTADPAAAAAFFRAHGTVVAKRPNSCGGREVFRLSLAADGCIDSDNIVEGRRGWPDFDCLFRHLTQGRREPLLLARYLPRVCEGDKRIVVVGGEPYGAYLRRAADGHWVQNVSRGGRCELDLVSDADRALVAQTSRPYLEVGINLLGYDLLRDDDGCWRISEINAGNIGGLFRLEYLGVSGVTDRFVAWLERFAAHPHRPREPLLPVQPQTTLETPR
jgi:glutathione synthase/RimK-type ligase-like ATP-grasp enzyme